jgi:D-alanyl-D-alanine carboxypeptidase
VLLTECEAERVDRAVAASGAWSRGLLIAEAVRTGLANPELKLDNGRRLRRIDTLVPRKLIARLKNAAALNNVTQQHLLRTYLFQYLTAAPWEQGAKEGGRIVSCN